MTAGGQTNFFVNKQQHNIFVNNILFDLSYITVIQNFCRKKLLKILINNYTIENQIRLEFF